MYFWVSNEYVADMLKNVLAVCGTRLDELAAANAAKWYKPLTENEMNTRLKMRRLELAFRRGDIRLAHWVEHKLDLSRALWQLTGEQWYEGQMRIMKTMKKNELAQSLWLYQEALHYFKLKFTDNRTNPFLGDFRSAEQKDLERRVRVLDLALAPVLENDRIEREAREAQEEAREAQEKAEDAAWTEAFWKRKWAELATRDAMDVKKVESTPPALSPGTAATADDIFADVGDLMSNWPYLAKIPYIDELANKKEWFKDFCNPGVHYERTSYQSNARTVYNLVLEFINKIKPHFEDKKWRESRDNADYIEQFCRRMCVEVIDKADPTKTIPDRIQERL